MCQTGISIKEKQKNKNEKKIENLLDKGNLADYNQSLSPSYVFITKLEQLEQPWTMSLTID